MWEWHEILGLLCSISGGLCTVSILALWMASAVAQKQIKPLDDPIERLHS